MGSIFGVFWGSKKGTNFEMIFETIFSDSQGWAVTPAVACLRPKRPLGMALWHLWHGIGMQATASARPGPEGGRIEPAEPEPPPGLFICKVG